MKKTLRRFAPVALVLLGLTTLSFMAKDGITLRLKPQQGKTYTINSKASMMVMMEVQGQTMNQSQTVEARQSLMAKEITDAKCTFETQIEAVKMTISQMGMKLEYDSEHPEKTSPMLASQTKAFEDVIKKPSTVTYDNMGKVIDSLDLEISQLSAVILEMPKDELKVGSKWNNDKKPSVNGTETNANMTYTVTAISKKSVDVNVEGTITGSDETNGTYTGTASINPQTGLVISSSIKSNISMTISEQGMSIPMTMVGNTTVTAE